MGFNSLNLQQSCWKNKKQQKKVYILFTKAGDSNKQAFFRVYEELIELEGVPSSFLKTSLTQIWKKKGSAIDFKKYEIYSYETVAKQIVGSPYYGSHERRHSKCHA